MSKVVTLNRPALWRPIRSDETSMRKYSGGYPYVTPGGIMGQSSIAKPVTRYAKNFTKFRLNFSLFMFTDETDAVRVECFFAAILKSLKKPQITEAATAASMSNFQYLETYYEENK